MRSLVLAVTLGCGLAASLAAPCLACAFQTQAASDAQQQQQMAQVQPPPNQTSPQ